jgi:hypothetical protein
MPTRVLKPPSYIWIETMDDNVARAFQTLISMSILGDSGHFVKIQILINGSEQGPRVSLSYKLPKDTL